MRVFENFFGVLNLVEYGHVLEGAVALSVAVKVEANRSNAARLQIVSQTRQQERIFVAREAVADYHERKIFRGRRREKNFGFARRPSAARQKNQHEKNFSTMNPPLHKKTPAKLAGGFRLNSFAQNVVTIKISFDEQPPRRVIVLAFDDVE